MRKYGYQLSTLLLLIKATSLEASHTEEVRGAVIFGSSDTLKYSLRSKKGTSSVPTFLKPAIQGNKMSLDYQVEWMSCSDGDQSILVNGDSIIVQKIIYGGCVKTSRAYAFHAEMEG